MDKLIGWVDGMNAPKSIDRGRRVRSLRHTLRRRMLEMFVAKNI